jgi:hypothetical protein
MTFDGLAANELAANESEQLLDFFGATKCQGQQLVAV